MKRILLIMAALISLAPLAARADECAPPPSYYPCMADAYGRTVCASAPGQACMADGNGHVVCGINCQVGADGNGFCPG